MREKEFIDNIIDRCVHLTGGSNLSLILQLMDILLLIKKAVKDYEAKITLLEKQPLMDLLPKSQYVEYLEKIRNCMDGFKVTFVPNAGSGNYNSHIVDFLFPGEMIDSNRENAEKIRLVINTLESDDFSFTGFWTNGITNGLKALADCLEKISSLVEKQWTKQQYEFMAEEMVGKYTHVLSKTGKKAFDHYTSWKKRCLGDKGEYQGLLSVQLKNLLDTGFIIVDEEHLPNLYKKHKQVLAIYMDDDECSDVYLKKFYFLSKFLDHKNGCFLLGDKAALGKYLFLNRGELDIKDIEAFFFFVNICFWVNKDLTEMADIKMNFNGEVNIDRMFDIHDNENVVICTSATKPSKTRRQPTAARKAVKPSDKPMTLKYYTPGNKGVSGRQMRRVNVLYRLWVDWKWIDRNTSPDDFNALFVGEPRHCNITWTANSTTLTILLQELLRQDYIERKTGCAATSMVRNQFGKTPNSDRTRLDKETERKISLSLIVLDLSKPVPHKENGNSTEEDTSEPAWLDLYADHMRITKGV